MILGLWKISRLSPPPGGSPPRGTPPGQCPQAHLWTNILGAWVIPAQGHISQAPTLTSPSSTNSALWPLCVRSQPSGHTDTADFCVKVKSSSCRLHYSSWTPKQTIRLLLLFFLNLWISPAPCPFAEPCLNCGIYDFLQKRWLYCWVSKLPSDG